MPAVISRKGGVQPAQPRTADWGNYVAFREAGREFSWSVSPTGNSNWAGSTATTRCSGVGFYLNGFEEDIGDISMIGHDNAKAGVRQMGARYPEKSPALLRRGCDYLKEINFI
jgi:hypothetical protein